MFYKNIYLTHFCNHAINMYHIFFNKYHACEHFTIEFILYFFMQHYFLFSAFLFYEALRFKVKI